MTSLGDNLFHLARLNDAPSIEKLIIRDSGELDERDDNGLTAIHICATYGCVEACAILLKLGAKHSLQDFESGWTPLHRAFYFGNLKISLLLIRAGALIADDVEKSNWKTDVCPRRERWRSIRNLSTWKPNIDHDGLSPLDLLSLSLGQNLMNSKRDLLCTSVLSFGKADFTLGVPLPNSVVDVLRPRRIDPLSCECITQIVASKYHSVALTKNGEVYSWGHGRAGRLGHSDESTQPEPKLISMLFGITIRMISAGENHTLAISSRGDIFSWGSDRFGQLGYGGGDAGKGSFIPLKIENLKKSIVVAIAAGDTHSVCFTDIGEIYSWGSNKEGQLGIPPLEIGAGIGGGPGVSVPKRVYIRGGKNVTKNRAENRFQAVTITCPLLQIVASRCSTLLLCHPEDYENNVKGYRAGMRASTVNEVYQWGHGSPYPNRVQFSRKLNASGTGQGIKDRDYMVDRFFSNVTASAVNIVQLSAGLNHNVALSSTGHVYTWGLGSDQLGHGSHENRLSVPQLLETLLPENGGGRAVMVSAANDRTCVVSDVGDLYTWGATAEKGVLGLGSGSYQPIPKLVGGVKRAVSVAAGGDYTLVLTSASVPDLPFQNLILSNENSLSGLKGNKPGKAVKNNIVVVSGLSSKNSNCHDNQSTISNQINNSGTVTRTTVLTDNEVNSDDESRDNDDDDDDEEEEENEENEDERGDPFQSRSETATVPHTRMGSSSGIFLSRALSLQELCEKRICESVDTRNVVALLAHSESIGARVLTAFCTQFIHSNLDAILVQSRLSDLDILIADLGFSEALSIGLRSTYSTPNTSSTNSNLTGSTNSLNTGQTSGKIHGSTSVTGQVNGIRHSQSRKLSKEDIEWHSRDSKYGETRERSFSGSGNTGSFHKAFDGSNVSWNSNVGRHESKGDAWSYPDDFGREGTGRDRSKSKDLDSVPTVLKMIKSVKKKIQSIEELEIKLRDGIIKELNDEQRDKVSRKESLQSELKRLNLICTRLQGEERVKIAAKAQRGKTINDVEKDILSDPLQSSQHDSKDMIPNILIENEIENENKNKNKNENENKNQLKTVEKNKNIKSTEIILPLPFQEMITDLSSDPTAEQFKVITASVTHLVGQTTVMKNKNNEETNEKFNEKSNKSLSKKVSNISDVSSSLSSPSSAQSELQKSIFIKPKTLDTKKSDYIISNDEFGSSKSKSFTAPTFIDWLKVTEIEIEKKIENPSSPVPIPIPTTPLPGGKKGWGTVTSPVITVALHKDNFDSSVNDHCMGVIQRKKQIVSTVQPLQITPVKSVMSYYTPSTSTSGGKIHSTPISEMQPFRDQEREGNTDRQSGEISLADLMITPKRKNNGKKNIEIVTTPVGQSVDDSKKLILSKSTPSCPWLSSPTLDEKVVKKIDKQTSNYNIDINVNLKSKTKTFNEIQYEEERARLESNLHSLKGNDNPWYQERRKRADSIEAVIRSQAEEKLREEDRQDEENAIREVELLMKKEKREKMKYEKNIQKAKLQAKLEAKEKVEARHPSHEGGAGKGNGNGNVTGGDGKAECSPPNCTQKRGDNFQTGKLQGKVSEVQCDGTTAVTTHGTGRGSGRERGKDRGRGRGRGRERERETGRRSTTSIDIMESKNPSDPPMVSNSLTSTLTATAATFIPSSSLNITSSSSSSRTNISTSAPVSSNNGNFRGTGGGRCTGGGKADYVSPINT